MSSLNNEKLQPSNPLFFLLKNLNKNLFSRYIPFSTSIDLPKRPSAIKINGFDERYEAPSIGEDSDVQFRLELFGIKIKSINHSAVQYHLFHQLQQRHHKNLEIFEQVKKSNTPFTPFGFKK